MADTELDNRMEQIDMYKKTIEHLSNEEGYTLVELTLVMTVLLILMVLAVPKFTGRKNEVTLSKLLHETTTLSVMNEMYFKENNNWPLKGPAVEVVESPILNDILNADKGNAIHLIDERKLNEYLSQSNKGIADYGMIVSEGPLNGMVIHLEGVKDNDGITHHNQRINSSSNLDIYLNENK